MNVKVTIFDNENYTDHSFTTALTKELSKVGRTLLTLESEQKKEKFLFRSKDYIVITIQVDGEEVYDPDEYNEIISAPITKVAEELSFEIYGIE